jgi:hypothetical protein
MKVGQLQPVDIGSLRLDVETHPIAEGSFAIALRLNAGSPGAEHDGRYQE